MSMPSNHKAINGVPIQLFIEATTACDLNCRHCYIRAGEGKTKRLPTKTLVNLLHEFADIGGRCITLSGGEPTLYPDWKKILMVAHGLGLETTLLTNGTRMDEEAMVLLRSSGSDIAISLDGMVEAHDRVRGEGTFDKTMKTLNLLAENQLIEKVILCFTPMLINTGDLPDVVDFAHRIGIPRVYLSLFENRGRAVDGEDGLGLDGLVTQDLLFTIISLQEHYPGVSIECPNLRFFTERLRGAGVDAEGIDRTIRVTAEGDMYLTAYLDDETFRIGKYPSTKLKDAWQCGKVRQALLAAEGRITLIQKCRTCVAGVWCQGGSAALAWTRNETFYDVDGFCDAKRAVAATLTGNTP